MLHDLDEATDLSHVFLALDAAPFGDDLDEIEPADDDAEPAWWGEILEAAGRRRHA